MGGRATRSHRIVDCGATACGFAGAHEATTIETFWPTLIHHVTAAARRAWPDLGANDGDRWARRDYEVAVTVQLTPAPPGGLGLGPGIAACGIVLVTNAPTPLVLVNQSWAFVPTPLTIETMGLVRVPPGTPSPADLDLECQEQNTSARPQVAHVTWWISGPLATQS